MSNANGIRDFDLSRESLREVNRYLHRDAKSAGVTRVRVHNPDGAHALACGIDTPLEVEVLGNAGYYVGGMNKHARITVHGNASTGAGENMMSGEIRIKGFASMSAGAS